MRKRKKRTYKQRRKRKRRVSRLKVLGCGALATALAALVVVIAIDAYGYLSTSDRFAVQAVDVAGVNRLSPLEICRVSGLLPGISVFDINVREVARRVESMPRVLSAEVEKQPPNHVTITVEEREPVAVVRTGQPIEIDRFGVVLGPPIEKEPITVLPEITGKNMPADFVAGSTVKLPVILEAIALCELLVETGSAQALGVKTIDISDPQNLVMHIENVTAEIRWGTGNHELRLAKLMAVWERSGGSLPHSEYVDLRQGEYIPAK